MFSVFLSFGAQNGNKSWLVCARYRYFQYICSQQPRLRQQCSPAFQPAGFRLPGVMQPGKQRAAAGRASTNE